MKNRARNCFRNGSLTGQLVFAVVLGACCQLAKAGEAPKPAGTLCVMTYNLRYASPNPPNAWPQRRPLMRECIEKVSPDLLGTQEGLYQQLKDMAADLPEYTWLGLGREGGSQGEFMAI